MHTRTDEHTGCFLLFFTVIALRLRGLHGSQVCPVSERERERERSGLKGSLSTYTQAEDQTIVRGAGWAAIRVRGGKEERGRNREGAKVVSGFS